jgi:hypothetical protein
MYNPIGKYIAIFTKLRVCTWVTCPYGIMGGDRDGDGKYAKDDDDDDRQKDQTGSKNYSRPNPKAFNF